MLYGAASFMKYFFEFFSSPFLGNLSDSYGRKVVLLCSLFAFCFEFLILALYPSVLSVFITRAISGLLDSTTSNIHAIVTDIANYNNESVTKPFGSIGAAFGLGFIIGPAAGSYLASISLSLCFFVAGFIGVLAFFITVFFVDETNMNMRIFSYRRANPILALRFFFSNKLLATLAVPYAISHMCTGIYFIWVLYMQTRLKVTIVEIGLFLSSSGLMVVFVQGILIQFIIPRIWSDERATVICLGIACVQMFLYGLANNLVSFYIIMLLFSPGSMYGAALKSLLVKAAYGKGLGLSDDNTINNSQVDEAGQGALQGALGSVRTITAGIGSILFTSVFSFSMGRIQYDSQGYISSKLSGSPFFIAFLLYMIATLHMNQTLDYYNSSATINMLRLTLFANYNNVDTSSDANSVISTTSSMDEEYEELGLARISPKKKRSRHSDVELPDFPIPIVKASGLGLGSHSDEGSLIGESSGNDITVINSSIKKRDKTSNIDVEQIDERMSLLPKNKDGMMKKSLKYSGDENDNNKLGNGGKWIYLRKDIQKN